MSSLSEKTRALISLVQHNNTVGLIMFDNNKTTFDNESTTLDKLFERIKISHFKNRAERDIWEHNQTNDTRDPWRQNDDTDCYDTLE